MADSVGTEPPMTPNIPIRAPGLIVDEEAEGLVVHQGAVHRVHHLNNTAASIFELCSGTLTITQIAAALQATFALDTEPLAEVTACLHQLAAQNIVRMVEAKRPRPAQTSEPIRVLAFTPSRERPYFLRHCILQMRSQSYAVDHSIYINGDEHPGTLYDDLLDDHLFVRFGPSSSQHDNYVSAIETAPYGCYDLFCKIDDDDVYRLNYIEEIVADFRSHRWDFSGTHSDGRINGWQWLGNSASRGGGLMTGLCDSLGLEEVMPPTMAFSRQGIECIRSLGTVPVPNNVEWEMQRNEDMAWVRTLAASGLRQGVRAESNFIYHIHGANLSTGSWLLTDERKPATSTLNAANDIEGWSADEEAELLSTAVRDALTSLPAPQRIVEIGSYCGRSTVVMAGAVKALEADARVYAIDPHEGDIGTAGDGLLHVAPTLARFKENIEQAGVADVIELLLTRSYETEWRDPISLLLVDGLHDYDSVARDFRHFEPWLVDGGLIAFHDYADYYPGVVQFVDLLTDSGDYERVQLAASMMLLRRRPA
jgi:predicted O-methyltransferase YrrM